MAQIEGPGNKKNPNFELNLVPFIDLMCVCITFLLITAVWTQVSMIQLGTSMYGKKTHDDVEPPKEQDFVAFRVDIKNNGYIVNIGLKKMSIPKVQEQYDTEKLLQELKSVKTLYPDKKDAVISVAEKLPYETMIVGMDNLIEAGFTDIGIAMGEVK